MTKEDKDILLRLLQQHKELGISEQIDYQKFYLYSIITLVATGTGDWVYFDVPTTCPNDYYDSNYKGTTSLKRIESYRLRELIMEDLRIYQPCSITDIHERIGKEIPLRKLQFQIKQLIAEGKLDSEGQKRWTKYRIKT